MHTTTPYKPLANEENETEQGVLFFRKIAGKFFSLWPWLIVSVAICLGLAFVYLKLAYPSYKVHASVLVQDDKKSTSFGEAGLLEDFGLVGKSTVDNEAEIFKSRALMEEVVKKLSLTVNYSVSGKLKTTELYTASPVRLQFLDSVHESIKAPVQYTFQFDPKRITQFKLENAGKKYAGKLGDTLLLPEGSAILHPGPGFAKWNALNTLNIQVRPFDLVVQQYMSSLKVEIPNKQVSVIYLSLNNSIPEKGEAILNDLIVSYMQANVNDKNRIADSTMKFIADRLRLVTGELSGIEKDIQTFKTDNKLTDLATQSTLLLQNTSEYAKQQTGLEVQLSVVSALEQFLQNNMNNSRVVPSSLVMQDAGFISLVQRYNEMQLQRDKALMGLTLKHPVIETMDEQLRNLRLELLSSIASVKKGIEISVAELKKRTDSFESQVSKVPAKERTYLDFTRQQSIKQELYLFLLKKMEETAISKSATIANARIIDQAKANNLPISPKKGLILLSGLLAGLVIPFFISFGKDIFNNRIDSPETVAALTNAPVIGEIGHNDEGSHVVISMKSRRIISEQFRSLRTNIQFLLPGDHQKTILVTSSMSGEGKSFLSINLCATLALAGKKVILLELDLRKPKISENLQLEKKGFSNYIISAGNDWRPWIQPSGTSDSFDVLSSGSLPPNPTELLMLPKTVELFRELKEEYDYIIIDTPPAGMVTDAEILGAFADATFYIVRHRLTFKQQVALIEKFFRKNSLPKINVVVNDIQFKKKPYGYGYGYSYGYGYTENEQSPKSKKRNKRA